MRPPNHPRSFSLAELDAPAELDELEEASFFVLM
jgi:hypothetical protein